MAAIAAIFDFQSVQEPIYFVRMVGTYIGMMRKSHQPLPYNCKTFANENYVFYKFCAPSGKNLQQRDNLIFFL